MSSKAMGEQVLRNLRRITRAIDLHSKKLARDFGLTGPQAVLLQIMARQGPCPISTLAQQASIAHATTTDILNRLERRGLVERHRDQKDKRRIFVQLTGRGEELIAKAPPLLQEQFLQEFQCLADWEQTMLLSSLQRIAGLMDARTLDAAPMLTSGSIELLDPEY